MLRLHYITERVHWRRYVEITLHHREYTGEGMLRLHYITQREYTGEGMLRLHYITGSTLEKVC